jgi:RNA polymerase sigma-70 factor (ECF subfamily)
MDDSAFMERWVACQSRLYRFVATLVPGRADAEDLFQKTCLSAWEGRAGYDPGRDLFLWLCGIARNHVRHFYRSRRSAPVALAPDVVEQLADLRISEDARAEERQKALDDCLGRLSPADRGILGDYYGGRESVRELAARLGRGTEALFKALQRLRTALHDCVNARLSGGPSP